MRKVGYLLISVYFLTACQSSTSSIEDFNMSDFKEIKGTPILKNADILNPQDIVSIDSGVLITDYKDSYLLQYYKDFNDNNPQYLAPKGTGPNEFINTRNIYFNPISKKLFIYDSQLKRAIIYDVKRNQIATETTSNGVVDMKDVNGYEIMPLGKDFITNGVFKGQPFALVGQNGKLLSSFGTFPPDSIKSQDPISLHLIYQSIIIGNPQGTRMVSASPFCDWLVFYDMEKEKPILLNEYYSYSPKLHTKNTDANTTSLTIDSDSKYTYSCLASTENYVYILFDGRTQKDIDKGVFQSKKILKFSWDGEFINGYIVKEKLYSFSVSNDDSKLLGLVDDGEDNIYIKLYEIDSDIKN